MRTLVTLVVLGLLSIGASACKGDDEGNGGAGAGGAGSGAGGASVGGGRAGTGGGGGGDGGSSAAGNGGGGASACADQGEACGGDGDLACCDGLTCCSGIPVPAGEEFCGTTCPKSDRNAKRDFTPIASQEVLDGVKRLPISSWRYDDEPVGTAHIGPMAQDFKATFRVGKDERYIATVDADGVALAAIQALSQKLDRLELQQRTLQAENAALRAELAKLRAGASSSR